jgi:hypothetical protein
MKPIFLVIVFVVAVILAPAAEPTFAQSSPPLLTNNPGTPGSGKWEINIGFAMERLRHESLYEAPILDINYGLGERMQLKYEIPWLFLNEKEGGTINGPGNSEIGFKYRFLDEKPHGISMSVYPQFSFNNPTSSADRGLVDPGVKLILPLQIVRRFGPVGVNLEVGYSSIEHEADEWLYGLAMGWPLSERFELLGEVNGTAVRGFGSDALVFNFGGLLRVHKKVNLLFSAGRGFCESNSRETKLLGFAGLQFAF